MNLQFETEDFYDNVYGDGFTLGMFHKRNLIKKMNYEKVEASDYNQLFIMGYEDGYEVHESAF
jgi:hypothetical protein